jgi:hypothetical protein
MTNHRGISKFLDSDYDMVHLVQTLLHSIQIQVYSEWVKGHYTPKKMELKYIINHLADDQAMVFLSTPPLGYTPCHMPMTYPGFGIRLHYKNSIIVSGLYKTLSSALHDRHIIAHITRKTGWDHFIFESVNWDAHGRAFCHLTTHQRLHASKLIHGLAHTNRKSFLFYNTSSLCPLCLQSEETFHHILTCTHHEASCHRDNRLSQLEAGSPSPIVKSISHGFHYWHGDHTVSHPRALVAGSLHPADILLTSAFYEQFHTITWYQFCLGCISRQWGTAANTYGPNLDQSYWSSLVISLLWSYTRSLWKFRNTFVHQTTESNVDIRKLHLQQLAAEYYSLYDRSPQFIQNRFHDRFTQRTLQLCLQLSHGYLNSQSK